MKVRRADYFAYIHSGPDRKSISTLRIQCADGREIDIAAEKPALLQFGDLDDMKESLAWCMNCFPIKNSHIRWRKVKDGYDGVVALFN